LAVGRSWHWWGGFVALLRIVGQVVPYYNTVCPAYFVEVLAARALACFALAFEFIDCEFVVQLCDVFRIAV
jgi:hypothetical protein